MRVLREGLAQTLRLIFRCILRGILRDLARLIFTCLIETATRRPPHPLGCRHVLLEAESVESSGV